MIKWTSPNERLKTYPKSKYSKILAPNGIYVTIARLDSKENMKNLIFIKELIEAGKIKAVIDRCYSLEQIIEAQFYFKSV